MLELFSKAIFCIFWSVTHEQLILNWNFNTILSFYNNVSCRSIYFQDSVVDFEIGHKTYSVLFEMRFLLNDTKHNTCWHQMLKINSLSKNCMKSTILYECLWLPLDTHVNILLLMLHHQMGGQDDHNCKNKKKSTGKYKVQKLLAVRQLYMLHFCSYFELQS